MKRIAAVFLLLAVLHWDDFGPRAAKQAKVSANTYYISPDGSDQNSGTLESPWLTLAHALNELSPGDILNLRGGTYYEHEITIDLAGTAAAPITIQSYPGEQAVIDGGIPFFRAAPNTEWELVNGDLHLYRSRRTFSGEFDFVRAWLLEDDVQLVEYESVANLESTNFGPINGLDPVYVGPGLQLRGDGHLYIRLVYNPNDLTDAAGMPITPKPSDIDPNHNQIAVFFSDYIFRLESGSYLQIKDLDFAHSRYILDVRNSSHHVVISDCRMNFGVQGILFREEAYEWEISNCEFNNGVPDYIYWADVKNREQDVTEAYPEFQSVAVKGATVNSTIHHNLFRNTFDALTVEEGSSDTRITHNAFMHVRDDAINLSRGISNVEVAHNLIWHGMGGIANLSSNLPPGHVYIHHNVIDNSAYQRGGRPGNYREDNWPVWNIGSPFPDHDDGSKDSWWKIYNNTIVTRQDFGHQTSPAGPDEVTGNPNKFVLNNIFYIIDERIIFRDDLMSAGSHYDGNVFYRGTQQTLPLFLNFGDGGRYYSLQEFQVTSGTDWEQNGLEADPGFQLADLQDNSFDFETIWQRYRPTNEEIFTIGAPYDGRDWPEAQGVTYRGAIPGSKECVTFLPYITDRLQFIPDPLAKDAPRSGVSGSGVSGSCILEDRGYVYVR